MRKVVLVLTVAVLLALCAAGSALAHPHYYNCGYAGAYAVRPVSVPVAVPVVAVPPVTVVHYAPAPLPQPCVYHYYPAPRVLYYPRTVKRVAAYSTAAYPCSYVYY